MLDHVTLDERTVPFFHNPRENGSLGKPRRNPGRKTIHRPQRNPGDKQNLQKQYPHHDGGAGQRKAIRTAQRLQFMLALRDKGLVEDVHFHVERRSESLEAQFAIFADALDRRSVALAV